MQITKMEYPVCGAKKYKVIHNGKEYSCYIKSCTNNLVVTGNGNEEIYKDITNTNLGAEIIIACYNSDRS